MNGRLSQTSQVGSFVLQVLLLVCVGGEVDFEIASPVCKIGKQSNGTKFQCGQDPDAMLDLLSSTKIEFAYMIRCSFAFSESVCNNFAPHTCTWKNNKCKIQQQYLLNTINNCVNNNNNNQSIDDLLNCQQIEIDTCKKNLINDFRNAPTTCQIFKTIVSCTSNEIEDGQICVNYQDVILENNNNNSNNKIEFLNQLNYVSNQFLQTLEINNSTVDLSLDYLEKQLSITKGSLDLYSKCEQQSLSNCGLLDKIPTKHQQNQPQNKKDDEKNCYVKKILIIVSIVIVVAVIVVSTTFGIVYDVFQCFGYSLRQKIAQLLFLSQNSNENNINSDINSNIEMQNSDVIQGQVLEDKKIQKMMESLQQKMYQGDCDSFSCAICLEDIQTGEYYMHLDCSHSFHKVCLIKWISLKGVKVKCPLCNACISQV